MKRIIGILLICTTLCSCAASTNNETEVSQQSKNTTSSPGVVSGSAVATESPAPTKRIIRRRKATPSPAPTPRAVASEKVTPGIVIDETGKKHKLKLGNVDVENTIVSPQIVWFPSNYAQVVNNHYYFLRTDGERNYTIYRDKGKEVGEFSLKEGMIDQFVFYRNKFYAVTKQSFEKERGKKLVEIDLKKHRVINLCNLRFDYKKEKNEFVVVNGMYKGICYWQSESGTRSAMDLKKRKAVRDSIGSQFSYAGTFIDGKIYNYEIKSGKKIEIYSLDLNNSRKEKVLEFKSTSKISEEDAQYVKGVEMDEDYIYCGNYLIPRRGGTITKLPDRVIRSWDNWISPDPETTIFTYNKKFVFYMDGKGKIHRFDKKTKKDVIISTPPKVRAMDIQCTENGLYMQEFDESISPEWLRSDEHWDYQGETKDMSDSCSIYYMDCNGENIKKMTLEMTAG